MSQQFSDGTAVPYELLEIDVLDHRVVHVVQPGDVPNPLWLNPGAVSAGMQKFGADLLDKHPMLLIPSVVSRKSWNLVIDVRRAAGQFQLKSQEPFGLDGRLKPVV